MKRKQEKRGITIGDLVVINYDLLKLLSDNGSKISDYQFAELWKRYCVAVKNGEKVSALVAEIVERNGISETQVWRAINRMRREVDIIGNERKSRRKRPSACDWF